MNAGASATGVRNAPDGSLPVAAAASSTWHSSSAVAKSDAGPSAGSRS